MKQDTQPAGKWVKQGDIQAQKMAEAKEEQANLDEKTKLKIESETQEIVKLYGAVD